MLFLPEPNSYVQAIIMVISITEEQYSLSQPAVAYMLVLASPLKWAPLPPPPPLFLSLMDMCMLSLC